MVSASPIVNDAVVDYAGLGHQQAQREARTSRKWRLGRRFVILATTHRPLSSSFLWFIFRILYGSPTKELLRGRWV